MLSNRLCFLVIGVSHNNLWFHVDGDKGATYWENAKEYKDLILMGFSTIDENSPNNNVRKI